MLLTDDQAKQYQTIYERHFNRQISSDEAKEQGMRLLWYVKQVTSPLSATETIKVKRLLTVKTLATMAAAFKKMEVLVESGSLLLHRKPRRRTHKMIPSRLDIMPLIPGLDLSFMKRRKA